MCPRVEGIQTTAGAVSGDMGLAEVIYAVERLDGVLYRRTTASEYHLVVEEDTVIVWKPTVDDGSVKAVLLSQKDTTPERYSDGEGGFEKVEVNGGIGSVKVDVGGIEG
ncbi:MAG: hypothetical protein SV253_03390 [Halobacteria archaeon]|nr:hypothetical protein [Halobacteria archaeon]